jgi:hypothetical protein
MASSLIGRLTRRRPCLRRSRRRRVRGVERLGGVGFGFFGRGTEGVREKRAGYRGIGVMGTVF